MHYMVVVYDYLVVQSVQTIFDAKGTKFEELPIFGRTSVS